MENFYDNLERFEDQIAVIAPDAERLTYRSFAKEADAIANRMPERCVVFLICSNTLAALEAYIGCLRRRVVPVLINEAIEADLLQNLMSRYEPAYVFAAKEKMDVLAKEEALTLVGNYRGYTLCKRELAISYPIYKELALLLTTSGSTGSPKLVRQTYENISANAASIAAYLEIVPEDRAIMTLPMSYTYGLSIINSHLLMGATVIMNDYTLMNKEFWALLKEENATTFGGVPYIYDMLKKLRFGNMELPSLRYLTQAGGKLSKEMAEEFNEICTKKGIKLIIMYGQTEATARMSYLPWESAKEKAGSMGIAIPGGRFELWDVDENPIEAAEVVGELVYYGKNVTLGYAEQFADLLKGDERGGRLITGDMAKRDSDGFYYIVGRKKRFLKIFGNRVNLDEVEGLLRKEGFDCVCAGEDDAMKIYTTETDRAEEILSFVTKTTHLSKTAFTVLTIAEIPRNEAGKVLYSKL
ncbi:MAG: long-chain acyl-CoA synthetase [Clostridiales bacterium]|nr:long-chain acyl-CoA synthetase [Clostridiales bacterium]